VTPLLAGLCLFTGAWDDFPPAPAAAAPRPPNVREVGEAYDDVQKALAAWQRERAAFKQAQHELAVTRDVRDLQALPWPDTRDVEVVKNPDFKGGRSKVLQPKGKKLSPAEAKLQAELDAAEARAEDYRLRCTADPAACSQLETDRQRVQAGNEAFEEAARKRQADLERREQAVAKRQQELEEQQKAMEDEAEKMKKALDARRKSTESQAKTNDAALRGMVDSLSGD
jgi:hypothetical protein